MLSRRLTQRSPPSRINLNCIRATRQISDPEIDDLEENSESGEWGSTARAGIGLMADFKI